MKKLVEYPSVQEIPLFRHIHNTIKRYKNVSLGFLMVVCLPAEINLITTAEMFMKIVVRKCYQHSSRHYNLGKKKQHTIL
jgi:hypothetical protein